MNIEEQLTLGETAEATPVGSEAASHAPVQPPSPSSPQSTGGQRTSTSTADQFRLLVDNVLEYAIFLLDPNGYVVTWNKGAERVKGYRASEIIGKHFSVFYTQEDIQRGHPPNELVIAMQVGRYEEEGWRVRKDGTLFWANVVITALQNDDGTFLGFGKVTRDLTERKRAEEERIVAMRDQISRSFLRDILFSVTEGRLRFCEDLDDLPERLAARIAPTLFDAQGISALREAIVSAAASISMPKARIHEIVTGASEAAMNAVVHAKNATYSICCSDQTVQVWIDDAGSGIEVSQLHRATLERGFTTRESFGHGFWLMLHTCDRLWLRSTPNGTTVVLEEDAREPEPQWLGDPTDLRR